MAKTIAVCVLAALACTVSAERSFLRSLQQDVTCDNIKQLDGKCSLLCNCIEVAKPNLFQGSNAAAVRALCSKTCNDCVKGCKENGKPADACKNGNGASQGGLSTCVNEYLGARTAQAKLCVETNYKDTNKANDNKC